MERLLVARLLAIAPEARMRLFGLAVLGLGVTVTYVDQGILIARVLASIVDGGAVCRRAKGC